MASHVFQTDFPAAEAGAIATAIITRRFDIMLIRDGWIVAEYALGQFLPTGLVSAVPETQEREDEAMRLLADAAANFHPERHMHSMVQAGSPLPWATIFKVIIKAIVSVL